jgi:primosomal protein N' (replication factor Y)
VPELGRVVVLDEHDESYQGDQTPAWNARDVAIERAARAEAPCLLISPTPSLEALGWGVLVDPGPGVRRAGWPRLEIVDQRDLDPAVGTLFSPELVTLVRSPGRVLCVLNRTGRVRLLACGSCRSIARCAVCEAAVASELVDDQPTFVCSREVAHQRPTVCVECGSTRFRNLRLGVGRAREELEALVGEPVGEVTSAGAAPDPSIRVLIGTEAVLHRYDRADAVAFLDLDQQLLAVRFRAAEQTLALLGRAARIVGRGEGRLLVQTRHPDHPVLAAVHRRDPAIFTDEEAPMRRALGLPPSSALALVSGAGAAAFVGALPSPEGLLVQGPRDDTWRLRAPSHQILCDALAATPRPAERLRIEVDPLGA